MIRRLFIANRGEIALRVMRQAQKMGMTAILGASQEDATSLPAMLADEVVVVGPAPSAQSYLDIDAVVGAAIAARADAIHPGYGFLSENARFAQAVADAGMIFVGPDVSSLHAMGDKLMARKVGLAAGLRVVPGGEAATPEQALARAQETGFPVLIKAVAGGGGKGMKRVDSAKDLPAMIATAMAEAQASFGDPRVYIERFIASGRHVEVQVLGDGFDAIHLGTRDCSIQRRFQKLVEEAPAPLLSEATRHGLEQAAVALARSLGYRGAGTVEFLVDAISQDFFFLEMNARIQVEHPVTEVITGLDLVEQQLLIAGGARLGLCQEAIRPHGHAIEIRINAEDPDADFRPSPGALIRAAWPAGPGIRIDSHIATGGHIPPFYDSLMGKLIVWGPDRPSAVARLTMALGALSMAGVATTAPLHRRIAHDPRFIAGGVDTRFLEGL
jgi:acetyl-CoA carboxylase biotin carboxylase subunit